MKKCPEKIKIDNSMGRSLVLFLFFCTLSCVLPRKLYTEVTPLITMKRTPCYGECPQYMISIYESGKVLYNGVRFVQKTGCFQSNINRQKINYIKFLLDEIQFFDLDDKYISEVTDLPSVITEVFVNGNRHKVIDRLEAPKKLKNLYAELDLLVDEISIWEECNGLEEVD
ncbi:MAG: hypothetical protein CMD27_04215 [Flavobacteriales bacterium]|nr:hypothetical protein [Flavobacteriales bacterium]